MKEMQKNNDNLFLKIDELIFQMKNRVVTTVNTAMVYTYFEIGRYIVEDEQKGKQRAEYGKAVLKDVSARLTEKYGNGWSVENLNLMRKFFTIYSVQNTNSVNTVYQISDDKKSVPVLPDSKIVNTVYEIQKKPDFTLSWSHYLILMRIENEHERRFYEIECKEQNWSVRELARQVNSCLYERLALSRNKDEVMKLAQKGHIVEKPQDILRNPLTLEFLGLKPDSSYSETKLETALISKIQQFLLELGKGFLFEARQKRFTFDEKHFFVDLVFYNRLLRCYVLIDLKIDDLTHQDLGQMQMYVNYFDRYIKQDFENPTIGILLCKQKDDALVELTLPKDSNIYAQQYALYLPDKKLLQEKLTEWLNEAEK